MSKRARNFQLEAVITTLEVRAAERASEYGHYLSKWQMAKAKVGKDARRSYCLACGKEALIMPDGNTQAASKSMARHLPGMRGPAVMEMCSKMETTALMKMSLTGD